MIDGTADALRRGCHGEQPLSARIEPWQVRLLGDPHCLRALVERWGSPLNLIAPEPMARNAGALRDAASHEGIDLEIFFARKANKALGLVDRALELGLGVDVAGVTELEQVLARGARPERLIVTAAVKPRSLLRLCARHKITVAIDNADELAGYESMAAGAGLTDLPVAMRLAPRVAAASGAPTRFGMSAAEIARASLTHLTIVGIHFHLDGYRVEDRVAASQEALELIGALRAAGHAPAFLDIGGGVPMSYLERRSEWDAFWAEHRRRLVDPAARTLTYQGHGLGLFAHDGTALGTPNVYPYFQSLVGARWLTVALTSDVTVAGATTSLARALTGSGIALRCEPGRALLDGCGMTVARVVFRKRGGDGSALIGLEMNRTQCRSTSDDFLVDPFLIRTRGEVGSATTSSNDGVGEFTDGFLVGAYCIERELLTWRRLRFPGGVSVGDLVAFPNTAGYLMHILESTSHQMPLARNLLIEARDDSIEAQLDPIDVREHSEPR